MNVLQEQSQSLTPAIILELQQFEEKTSIKNTVLNYYTQLSQINNWNQDQNSMFPISLKQLTQFVEHELNRVDKGEISIITLDIYLQTLHKHSIDLGFLDCVDIFNNTQLKEKIEKMRTKTCTTLQAPNVQIEDAEQEQQEQLYKCPHDGCNKVFQKSYNLNNHYKSHSAATDKRFQCEQCSYSFSRKHDLNRHVKLHENVKQFKCNHCHKEFARLDAFKRHLSPREPGKLSACEKRYRSNLVLNTNGVNALAQIPIIQSSNNGAQQQRNQIQQQNHMQHQNQIQQQQINPQQNHMRSPAQMQQQQVQIQQPWAAGAPTGNGQPIPNFHSGNNSNQFSQMILNNGPQAVSQVVNTQAVHQAVNQGEFVNNHSSISNHQNVNNPQPNNNNQVVNSNQHDHMRMTEYLVAQQQQHHQQHQQGGNINSENLVINEENVTEERIPDHNEVNAAKGENNNSTPPVDSGINKGENNSNRTSNIEDWNVVVYN
ncbi:hypothetical protein HK099_003879 [Clydaea vesicula]|uniref:C2H2-type domain-containing protein n=1 Tax=Clydaea vesicula TaxID=447962 RepID=A0AAD5XZZ9_9FUNG|nr:hypothetical protein HK099_003879 [Clydaea vesicula]KAJ3379193.1 hypothetical protein HDU92_006844 [Lobulomyces angularis]